jgi:hexosaminidase
LVGGEHGAAPVQAVHMFAADLEAATGVPIEVVSGGHAAARIGDVLIAGTRTGDDESYHIGIGDKVIVTSASPAGLARALQTLLQLLLQQDVLPFGTIRDSPEYAERGILVDTIPRSFSRRWWDNLLREMAFLKFNELVVLLGGTGMPVADVDYLVERAGMFHINVTPLLGMPSHAHHLLRSYPHLALDPASSDPLVSGALDFTVPGALDAVAEEVGKHIIHFPGRYWHAGADEYLAYPAHARPWNEYPQLVSYARAQTRCDQATGSDALILFLNWLNSLVKSYGKVLRVWNDHLESGLVQLDPDIVVDHWYLPPGAQAPLAPQALCEAGNRVLNAHEDLTYYDMGWRHLDAARIFHELRVPEMHGCRVEGEAGDRVLGARLHIWTPENVKPEQAWESSDMIAENLFLPSRAFAHVTWAPPGGHADFTEFTKLAACLGRPPGWTPP